MNGAEPALQSVLELYEQIFGAVFWFSVGAWLLTVIVLVLLWLSPHISSVGRITPGQLGLWRVK